MKILIVSDTTKNNYSAVRSALKSYDIYYANKDNYKDMVKDFEYIIAGGEEYTPEILRNANKLKVISRCGHGTDAIDKEYCKKNNIKVLDARGALDDTIADVTIGYMIMALRRLREIDEGTRKEGWKRILGRNLTKKTVGIIGLGGIGTAVAKRLKAFRTNTIFYDINPKKQHNYDYAKYVELEELYEESDIITLHCDLNKQSRGMINRRAIEIMKDKVILINTARGPVISIKDLKQGLESGKVDYAVLDVYPIEPLPETDAIRNVKNVLLGSHTTWYSEEGQKALVVKAVNNLLNNLLFQEEG